MKRILFVDDEPNVLAGLRRMLRPMRHEWDMAFVPSGEAALENLAQHPCDVIVSDIRMPGMDGVALLERVAARCPAAVRIALSGHAEMESIVESVQAAHQFLAKPCEADTLKSTVDRACALRGLLDNPVLGRLICGMGPLPSLPSLYVELMREISSPDSSMQRVGEIIAKDVAMSARILQIVNSAFFGLRRAVSTPERAATVLGLDIIRALVLSAKVFSEFEAAGDLLDLEALWRHSSATAALARRVSEMQGQDGKCCDAAFTGGMLHDLGKLVLASRMPDDYRRKRALVNETGIDEVEAEQQVFQCTHMDVGAFLLGLWGLPDRIVEVLAYHHLPSRSVSDAFTPLTAAHVADALLRGAEQAAHGEPGDVTARLDLAYLERIGMSDRIGAWFSLHQSLAEDATRND